MDVANVLTIKLRRLRKVLKKRAKHCFGFILNYKKELLGQIDTLQRIQVRDRQVELANLQFLQLAIQQTYKREEIMWSQWARLEWIKQGGLNTAFFPMTTNMRKRKKYNQKVGIKRENHQA